VWAFALYPQDGTTRLVSRNHIRGRNRSLPHRMAGLLVMEPGSLPMLSGISERAARLAQRTNEAR